MRLGSRLAKKEKGKTAEESWKIKTAARLREKAGHKKCGPIKSNKTTNAKVRENQLCVDIFISTLWSGACIGISQGQIFRHMVMAAGMLGFRETRLQEQEAKISASRVGHDNVDPFLRYIKRARLGPDSFVR